jgi:hypothetical protein
MGRAVAMIAIATLLGGCGGTSLLIASRAHPPTPKTRTTQPSKANYLTLLAGEQQKLAAAERRLPHRVRTAASLSRAISLLGSAIRRLATDLDALHPPAPVRALHARLVATMRAYAVRLALAARDARQPDGVPRAAAELLSSTSAASRSFSSTIAEVDRSLAP